MVYRLLIKSFSQQSDNSQVNNKDKYVEDVQEDSLEYKEQMWY